MRNKTNILQKLDDIWAFGKNATGSLGLGYLQNAVITPTKVRFNETRCHRIEDIGVAETFTLVAAQSMFMYKLITW